MYERIKKLRKQASLTQLQISKILHCSQQIYSRYELGRVEVPTSILIRLSKFYNISVDYILGITDEKQPHKRKK